MSLGSTAADHASTHPFFASRFRMTTVTGFSGAGNRTDSWNVRVWAFA